MKRIHHLTIIFFLFSSHGLILHADEKADATVNPRLVNASSAYLRSAAHQPVHWYPWGEEAFQRAQTEDKPILLDIGAVWCHWCHVIDRESYENTEIAAIINEKFIPVKVDRDERPDLDTRFQHAVNLISGQGGWPLTAFLTPKGEVFFGGTYFPPEDRDGMTGMRTLLEKIARLYGEKKESLYRDADKLTAALVSVQNLSSKSGDLTTAVADQIVQNVVEEYDAEFGGFGTGPKFPSSSAMDLLMEKYFDTKDEKYINIVTKSLEVMARGGMRDQLGGGFHRYTTDRKWKVPHFEIMLDVNAGLLNNFSKAYQITSNALFKDTAMGILQYFRMELSNQNTGGFYASQDADSSGEKDGDFYTWTQNEVQEVLDPQTYEVIKRYFDIGKIGDMPADPARNILSVAERPDMIAKDLNITVQEVQKLIEKGQDVLRTRRNKREEPAVDQNIYVNWNGMMISSCLRAFEVFGVDEAKTFALKTLEYVMEQAYVKGLGLSHSAANTKSRRIGMLDDHVEMAQACLDAYEVTGDKKYRDHTVEWMDIVLEKFWDAENGGFYDILPQRNDEGLLKVPYKNYEDSPNPASNAVAVMVLDRLHYMTGRPLYRERAQKTLAAFAGAAVHRGSFAATFARALSFHEEEPPKVVVIGRKEDPLFQALVKTALQVYRPGKMVLALNSSESKDPFWSEDLRSLIKEFGKSDQALAFLCAGRSCAPPTSSAKKLKELIETFGLINRKTKLVNRQPVTGNSKTE